jgi:hypothetical protein
VVALVAFTAFGLLLVLARRFRNLEERVNLFLPISVGMLPRPGTPVAEFEATTVDGGRVSHADFAEGERIFALLTTGCGECITAASELRQHAASLTNTPVVGVIGPPEDRAPIVAQLEGHVQVMEEAALGPVATALEINEFPAVLLIQDGYIQFADHEVAPVLARLSTPTSAPAGTPH